MNEFLRSVYYSNLTLTHKPTPFNNSVKLSKLTSSKKRNGDGNGCGSGNGCGNGCGSGNGNDYGDGSGNGYGNGDGNGYG